MHEYKNTDEYEIFDVKRPLLEDFKIVLAKNSRNALQKYLNNKQEDIEFIRSNDIDCRFYVKKMPYGKKTWFAIKKKINKM